MRSLKGRIGIFVIIGVVLLPVLAWLFGRPLSVRFESGFMILTTLGQLTGILGMALFSITLILSARLHFLEEYFGGLDRVYNIHHKLGTIAFLFLLVHPVVLAVRYFAMSLADAALFLLPGEDWPKNFGIFALMLLMVLLSVTFFARWRYQILKFVHQILGFAFFMGALHSFLIPSDMTSLPLLRWFMIILASLALCAFLYRSLFGRFLVSRYTYVVEAVTQLDETITDIAMRPEGKTMHYIPGQFVFISFIDGGIESEVHPFSISSAPTDPKLHITIKALGDYTKTIRNLQVGATAKIEGPFGSFTYLNGENLKQVWIAGGIGITPFMNMARNLKVNSHTGHKIDFYYSAKTKQEMVFLKELTLIAEQYPDLTVIPFNADELGFLSMDAVRKMSGDIAGRDIYVCGPPPMMHSIIEQCLRMGIPRSLIHSEEFKLL